MRHTPRANIYANMVIAPMPWGARRRADNLDNLQAPLMLYPGEPCSPCRPQERWPRPWSESPLREGPFHLSTITAAFAAVMVCARLVEGEGLVAKEVPGHPFTSPAHRGRFAVQGCSKGFIGSQNGVMLDGGSALAKITVLTSCLAREYDMEIVLGPLEARVIGCLIEKEICTPDQYPLAQCTGQCLQPEEQPGTRAGTRRAGYSRRRRG